MSRITIIGAGQMGSALTFPAIENGHEVRLVGTHLDREIIDGLRENNYHKTLKATLYDKIQYYQIEELDQAMEGADVVIGGVSSFGVDWFGTEILPKLPDGMFTEVPSIETVTSELSVVPKIFIFLSRCKTMLLLNTAAVFSIVKLPFTIKTTLYIMNHK